MLFHEKLPHRFSQIIFHHADHAGRFGEIVRHLGVALCDALNPVNLAHDAFRLAQLLQGGTVNMLRDLLEQFNHFGKMRAVVGLRGGRRVQVFDFFRDALRRLRDSKAVLRLRDGRRR